jgi:hypothetical protein
VWIISSVRSRDRKKKKDDIFGDASPLLVPSERCVFFFLISFICQIESRKNEKIDVRKKDTSESMI